MMSNWFFFFLHSDCEAGRGYVIARLTIPSHVVRMAVRVRCWWEVCIVHLNQYGSSCAIGGKVAYIDFAAFASVIGTDSAGEAVVVS